MSGEGVVDEVEPPESRRAPVILLGDASAAEAAQPVVQDEALGNQAVLPGPAPGGATTRVREWVDQSPFEVAGDDGMNVAESNGDSRLTEPVFVDVGTQTDEVATDYEAPMNNPVVNPPVHCPQCGHLVSAAVVRCLFCFFEGSTDAVYDHQIEHL